MTNERMRQACPSGETADVDKPLMRPMLEQMAEQATGG